jgi:hypothetical protein
MKTVDAHRAKIKEKLKLKTTNELISYAARWTASPRLGRAISENRRIS